MGSAAPKEPEPTKACTKCKRTLPFSSFHGDRHKKDGRTARCKECINPVKIAYYWANRDALRAYHKSYKDNPKRREANRRYDRERWQRYPEKMLARLHLNRAVKRGEIERLPCRKCGDPRSCHAEEHRTSCNQAVPGSRELRRTR